MADEEKPPLTIQGACEELLKICDEKGIPRLKASQQILGYAVKAMKQEGYELPKLLADITRHWGHLPEKN